MAIMNMIPACAVESGSVTENWLLKPFSLRLQPARRYRNERTISSAQLQMSRSLQKELSCCPVNVLTITLFGVVSVVVILLIISFVYYRGYWLFFIFVILTFVFGALLVFTFLMRHYFLKLKLRNRTPGLNLKTRRPNFRQNENDPFRITNLQHVPVHFETIVEINNAKPHSAEIITSSDLPNYNEAVLFYDGRSETETPPPSYKQALLTNQRVELFYKL